MHPNTERVFGYTKTYSDMHSVVTPGAPFTNKKYKDYVYRKMLVQEYLKK